MPTFRARKRTSTSSSEIEWVGGAFPLVAARANSGEDAPVNAAVWLAAPDATMVAQRIEEPELTLPELLAAALADALCAPTTASRVVRP